MMTHHQRLLSPLAASAAINAPRSTLRGTKAVEQMADDMRMIKTRAGSATRDDLALIGWTSLQIDLHNAAARELALRDSNAPAD